MNGSVFSANRYILFTCDMFKLKNKEQEDCFALGFLQGTLYDGAISKFEVFDRKSFESVCTHQSINVLPLPH